jgi:hypothetical protein
MGFVSKMMLAEIALEDWPTRFEERLSDDEGPISDVNVTKPYTGTVTSRSIPAASP